MGRFAVIGGGVTGLSAAWELQWAGEDVVVFEAAESAGGKLRSSPAPGVGFLVEEGADAFLARVPDALELCEELGIHDLVHPSARNAWVDAGDGLKPLPAGQLLGVPTDLDELATSGLVTDAGLLRAREDLVSPSEPLTHDVSVGEFVRARLGDEVCDRLVEPLIGGINAGMADALSLEAVAPQVWACARRGGSLIERAAEIRAGGDPTRPVFATPRKGMGEIPRRLRAQLGDAVRTDARIDDVTVDASGATVTHAGGAERFDGLVLAAPVDGLGPVLAAIDPAIAERATSSIPLVDVAMVVVVAERGLVDHDLDGSGFVVARTAGRRITACSWGTSKWSHWDDGHHVVFRASVGHDGCTPDEALGQPATDEALQRAVLDDLQTIMDCDIRPFGVRVGRWDAAFPQYRVGHLATVQTVREGLRAHGPVEIAGMSFDGIGVPACIRSGRTAARSLLGSRG